MMVTKTGIVTWRIRLYSLCLLMCLACTSCVEVKEHLTVRRNGSGQVTMEVHAQRQSRTMGFIMSPDFTSNPLFAYPPLIEEALATLFPPDTFRSTLSQPEAKSGELVLGARIEFDDIHDLIFSPYGRLKCLEIEKREKTIRFSGQSGMAAVIYALTADDLEGTPLSGLAREQLTAMRNELDYEFKLTLPGEIVAGNGNHTGENGVWRIKAASLKETEKLRAAGNKAFKAECAASAIDFTLKPQGNIGLRSFQDQKFYAFPAQREIPTLDRIRRSGRYDSRQLIIKRYFSIAGESIPSDQNICCLQGALVLPNDIAPKRLSWVKTVEVIDERGVTLLLNKNAEESDYYCRNESPSQPKDETHTEFSINFPFGAPDWGTNKLRLFRGEIGMVYVTSHEVIQAADALPAAWIAGAKNHRRPYSDRPNHRILSPRLDELGIEISVVEATALQDLLNLQLSIHYDADSHCRLTGIQIYDSHGVPLPTYPLRSDTGSRDRWMMQLAALGFSKGPLSMAVAVDIETDALTIPILLQDIAIIEG